MTDIPNTEPPPRVPSGKPGWVTGYIDSPAGPVAQVSTALHTADHLGAVKVRLNIRRMNYAVEPGLYAVGAPSADSPVLVSANYKLSFDHLRRELAGLDLWIMVLDTKGINVWCAAGKGTFGTEEMLRRIAVTQLDKVVSHRSLIAPQLGAPGVAAHEVAKRSGFHITYGPVYARDIKAFLANGRQATPAMRRVRFGLGERLVVVPVELVQGGYHALCVAAAMVLLSGMGHGGYDTTLALRDGGRAALLVLGAYLAGGLAAPVLLPWLPGRAFSLKGALVGLALAALTMWPRGWQMLPTGGKLESAGWFLMMPAIAAYMTMNYTGASTYTSLSGVRKEMRWAVPMQITAGVAGLAFWILSRFMQ